MGQDEELLTVLQTTKLLHLSDGHVRQLLRDGNLKGSHMGRKWLIPRGEIESFGSGGGDSSAQEDAGQAERSGHWPKMRDMAQDLGERARLGAPLAELLDFPWRTWPDYSGAIALNPWPDQTISVRAEGYPIFRALTEHLPTDQVWSYLGQWKSALAGLRKDLYDLTDRVKGQAEVKRPDARWLSREQVWSGEGGLTDFFYKAAVLEIAECWCHLPPARWGYEVRPPMSKQRATLVRVRNSSSFVELAAGRCEELERIRDSHQEIVRRFCDLDYQRNVAESVSVANEAGIMFADRLEEISHLAVFPGICAVYRVGD